jgi:hypothetical protein
VPNLSSCCGCCGCCGCCCCCCESAANASFLHATWLNIAFSPHHCRRTKQAILRSLVTASAAATGRVLFSQLRASSKFPPDRNVSERTPSWMADSSRPTPLQLLPFVPQPSCPQLSGLRDACGDEQSSKTCQHTLLYCRRKKKPQQNRCNTPK